MRAQRIARQLRTAFRDAPGQGSEVCARALFQRYLGMGGVVEATDGPDQAWNSSDKDPIVILDGIRVSNNHTRGYHSLVRAKIGYASGVDYFEVCTKKRDENGCGYHVIGVATA